MTSFGSLVDLLQYRAYERSDALAFVLLSNNAEREATLTFASLEQRAHILAMHRTGHVAPGARVLLIFPNSLEFVVAYFACLIARAIAVPIMPPWNNSARDLSASIIDDCSPRLALVMPDIVERAKFGLWARNIPYHSVELSELDVKGASRLTPNISRNDFAFFQYTSGSTSTPKGVVVSHGNLLANLDMPKAVTGNHRGSTNANLATALP